MEVFKNALSHNGQRCDVYHTDADHFDDIPDELKRKAHAVCFWNGKILLVNHSKWDIWGIPGGTRDPGESIEDTLVREIFEEANCEVLDRVPLAYQKVVGRDGDTHFRLIYKCNVRPLGEFVHDVAGAVGKIAWIEPHVAESYVEAKDFKKRIFRRVLG